MYPFEYFPPRIRLVLLVFGTATVVSLLILIGSWYDDDDGKNQGGGRGRGAMGEGAEPRENAAFNATLGFARVYATLDGADAAAHKRLAGLSGQLGIDLTYINSTTPADGLQLSQQHGFLSSDPAAVAELLTHRRIYRDMVHGGVASAVILSSDADVEADVKQRLARVFSEATDFDILFLSRSHSEPGEPGVRELLGSLGSAERSDASQVAAAEGARRGFLARGTRVFRSTFPQGTTRAYAVNLRLARRLDARLERRMQVDGHGLDFVLADIAMVGTALGLSVAPPVAAGLGQRQYLSASTLHAMGLRADDPSAYPPYVDWADTWGSF
ncbi:hypothetical protein LPJ53_005746 [Coemansia erecta]|uniref:Uncharacterized protein n=1 Tax=Coemansia erecta TaxID=147472 RepID=A0A9W7XV09_9FUNG|nr:hypothetical protein LPJ53_005746 [Coemansia erecta]